MTLYLVATPIGHLEDITFRAVRILGEVSLIAAEDTRHTRKLLNHLGINTPLVSYHDYSQPERLAQLIATLQTEDVALVSDAGMPGLSDPGYELVQAAVSAGIAVSPVPGATAAIAALVSSGLPTNRFLFLGFLPRQTSQRRRALQAVNSLPYTLILYEAPHRLLALLGDLREILGDRALAIGRELTKLHEEIWRGPTSQALADFGGRERIRGELTLIVAGATGAEAMWDEAMVVAALRTQLAQGQTRKTAVEQVTQQSGWRKKQVYALALREVGG